MPRSSAVGIDFVHSAKRNGSRVHAVVADILWDRPTPDQIVDLVLDRSADAIALKPGSDNIRSMPTYRAELIAVATRAAAYFSHFWLPEPWTLLRSEQVGASATADLVLGSPSFGVLIDEIKGTSWVADEDLAAYDGQVAGLLELGRSSYGGAFRGVRLLTLAAPGRARFIAPDGTRTELWRSPYAATRRLGASSQAA